MTGYLSNSSTFKSFFLISSVFKAPGAVDDVVYENNVVTIFIKAATFFFNQKLNIQEGAQIEQSNWMSESKIIVTPKTVNNN